MKQEGTLAVGGNAGAHLPISTRPYGSEYARTVERNVAANEGVRRLKVALNDALAGNGTKPKPEKPERARRSTTTGRPAYRPLTPEQAQRAADAYANGAKVADLAKEFGCGVEAVRTGIRKSGVPLRIGGGRLKVNDQATIDLIVAQYQAGMSSRDVGEAFGLGRKAIRRVLDDAGVMRPRLDALALARRSTP